MSSSNIIHLVPPEITHPEMREEMVATLKDMIARIESGLTDMILVVESFDGDPLPYSTLFSTDPLTPMQMIGYLETLKGGIVADLLYESDDE